MNPTGAVDRATLETPEPEADAPELGAMLANLSSAPVAAQADPPGALPTPAVSEEAPPAATPVSESAPETPAAAASVEEAPPSAPVESPEAPPSAPVEAQDAPPSAPAEPQEAPPAAPVEGQDAPPSAPAEPQEAPPAAPVEAQDAPPSAPAAPQDAPPLAPVEAQDAPPAAPAEPAGTPGTPPAQPAAPTDAPGATPPAAGTAGAGAPVAPEAGGPEAQPKPESLNDRYRRALGARDFRAQEEISQELKRQAGTGQPFTPEQRELLNTMRGNTQVDATAQVALYRKFTQEFGAGSTRFHKESIGFTASSAPGNRSGVYTADSVGVEHKIGLDGKAGPVITPYAQHTWRSDRNTTGEEPHGLSAGVKVESPAIFGVGRVGVDVSTSGSNVTPSLIGKIESPSIPVPGSPDSSVKVGIDASLTVGRGNAIARQTAAEATRLEQVNARRLRESQKYGIPFVPAEF